MSTPKPAAWSDPAETRVSIDPTFPGRARRPAPPAEPRLFPDPIDPTALAARVLRERDGWDKPMRSAFWRECRHAMATLITHEQRELTYRRRMEMDCPDCGQKQQPAGLACWRCSLPITPGEWYDRRERYPGRKLTPAQRTAALARLARGRLTAQAAKQDRPVRRSSK